MKIIKNIIKNELNLIVFLAFQEILRILMKASKDLSITLKQLIIMIITVAILSVIQQLIKERYIKNHDRRKKIKIK